MTMQEHVNALLELTECRCDPCWTDRKLHAPDCNVDYVEHVDALVDEINRLNGFTPEDERRCRERKAAERKEAEQPKFPNLPAPTMCGFACFRRRYHRGLHQWEAHRLRWTNAQWIEHIADTERVPASIIDCGIWSEVREPCD